MTSPHQNPPQWQNTLLPQGRQQAPVPGTLFPPLLLVSSGQGRGKRGRRISSFYCEHNFLPNSLPESLGDLCLFIYLAGWSFLKPRLMRVLRVGTCSGCLQWGGSPCIPAEWRCRKYFLTHLFITSIAVTGQVKEAGLPCGHMSLELVLSAVA